MKNYLTVKQVSSIWGISDRRVRLLCQEGKIPGVIKEKKSYLIPQNAQKPYDGRRKKEPDNLFLKWQDDVVGIIDNQYNVHFTMPKYNRLIAEYTKGLDYWSRSEFEAFLSDRLISKDRRDIEHILFKLGFSRYNIIELAIKTKAINSSDLLWIASSENEKLSTALTEVFNSIFAKKVDLQGDSVDSPEGANLKRYGAYNGMYGIYKKRLHPFSNDIESEVAVYKIAQLIGVNCCPAYKVDNDTVFSRFMYDVPNQQIIHFRHFFDYNRGNDEYLNLLSVRPQYQADIVKMIALDFITRQDDRHLSNIAVKISGSDESFYPLYDNGRSLFYEDTDETVEKAVKDPVKFCTNFGPSGTYYDILLEISKSGINLSKLINLNVNENQIRKALLESDFTGYKLEGSIQWIMGALKILEKI